MSGTVIKLNLEGRVPDQIAVDLCRLADQYETTPDELAMKAITWYVTSAARRLL